MKKITYLFAILCIAQTSLFAQTTPIPDVNFEQALIFYGIDTNGVTGDILDVDAAVPTSLGLAGHTNPDMSVTGGKITNFSGIEAFVNLTSLNVGYCDMTTLDLTSNTLLETIDTEGSTALASINLTGLTAVTSLHLLDNGLTTLDVSTLAALTTLNVRSNNLTGDLNLSSNSLLVDVDCSRQSSPSYNTLTGIDMRNGNNVNVTAFNSDFNGAATCVFVDDKDAAYLAGWTIDFSSTFVNDEAGCLLLGTDDRTISVFSMYPNPTRNLVNVAAKLQSSIMDVYSITGKLVLSKALNFGDNNVNISSLSAGVYLAKFSSEDRSETKKLIIN
jgi:hypothetical protein